MPDEMDVLENLTIDGIASSDGLSPTKISDVKQHLAQCPVYNAHVVAKATEPPMSLAEASLRRRLPMFCHQMHDLLRAPHFLEHALDTYDIAKSYFSGEPPVLYSVNAFYTLPDPKESYLDTHGWHRDEDDRRQLVLFVFGNDVGPDAAHLYQRGSHVVPDNELARDFRAPPASVVVDVHGRAGTSFVADTRGLHMGRRPQSNGRMLLWARWGVSDPPQSYHWDKLSPLPAAELGERYCDIDPEMRHAIRHVVR